MYNTPLKIGFCAGNQLIFLSTHIPQKECSKEGITSHADQWRLG